MKTALDAADTLAIAIDKRAGEKPLVLFNENARFAKKGRANKPQDFVQFELESWVGDLGHPAEILVWFVMSDDRQTRVGGFQPPSDRVSWMYNGDDLTRFDSRTVPVNAEYDTQGLYQLRHARLLAKLRELRGPDSVFLLGTTSGTTDLATFLGIRTLNLHRWVDRSASQLYRGVEDKVELNSAETRLAIQTMYRVQCSMFVSGDGRLLKHLPGLFKRWMDNKLPALTVLWDGRAKCELQIPDDGKLSELATEFPKVATTKKKDKPPSGEWWEGVRTALGNILTSRHCYP